jgi:hypothetical protein
MTVAEIERMYTPQGINVGNATAVAEVESVHAPQGSDVGNAMAVSEVECVYSPKGPDVDDVMAAAEVECVYTPQGRYIGNATAITEVECVYTPQGRYIDDIATATEVDAADRPEPSWILHEILTSSGYPATGHKGSIKLPQLAITDGERPSATEASRDTAAQHRCLTQTEERRNQATRVPTERDQQTFSLPDVGRE